MYAAVLLLLLVCACVIWEYWRPVGWSPFGVSFGKILAVGLLVCTVVGPYLLGGLDGYHRGWLRAYRYLHGQSDLGAVLNLYSKWQESGSYYHLHRDVPLYFPEHFETQSVPLNEARACVSHTVATRGAELMPGFHVAANFDDAQVWASDETPTGSLDVDTKRVRHGSIDGRLDELLNANP